jgi:hypothetical protein
MNIKTKNLQKVSGTRQLFDISSSPSRLTWAMNIGRAHWDKRQRLPMARGFWTPRLCFGLKGLRACILAGLEALVRVWTPSVSRLPLKVASAHLLPCFSHYWAGDNS